MNNSILSIIFYAILSGLSVFSLELLPYIPKRYLPVLELLPFLFMLLAFFLGLKFNRSQLFFSALLFTLVYGFYFWFAGSADQKHYLILNCIAIWMSFNVMLIASYSERGVFNFTGLIRLIVILLPVGVFVWFLNNHSTRLNEWIYQPVFSSLKIELLFFSEIALLVILLSIFVISFLYLHRGNPFRLAMFSGMMLVLYAITFPQKDTITISVLFSWALLIPLITLVSESYRMAYQDELTQLPGRRALNEHLKKLGSKFVIAMLDVDHFKKFNDKYGHDAGDDVLRLLGHRLKTITGGGKPFRYGGEEFTIVFSGMNAADTEKHLEKLRQSVADKQFSLRKQERRSSQMKGRKRNNSRNVKVTISIGYAERNDQHSTPAQVLKAADKALYKAKKKGRNCISQ